MPPPVTASGRCDRYFLGLLTAPRPDWATFLLEPRATRSTKAESIAKEVEEKKAKQEAAATTTPIAATVLSTAVLNQRGEEVFNCTQPEGSQPGLASFNLLGFLSTALADGLTANVDRLYDTQARLFGFLIRERLKLVALDALRYCRLSNTGYQLPIGLWYHRPFEPAHYVDPYEVFVHSEMRGDVDFAGVCDFLRIARPTDADMRLPHVQAELARQFALVGQMITG